MTRKHTTARSIALRAEIILRAEKQQDNQLVAKALNTTPQTVGTWTHRWNSRTKDNMPLMERLCDLKRSGKPSSIKAEQLCQLVALACDNPENHGRPISHWTQSELAEEAIKQAIFEHISASYIGKLLASLSLKPHKNRYWLHKKVDEKREEKIKRICSLYQQAEALKKRE